MAQGLGEFQSSEESEEVSVVGLVQVKSDGEIHVHLPLQEGSITTGGDTGTVTEQLQDTIENLTPLHGGREHGSLVYSSSNPVSDENYNRKLFIPKCCDELVEYVATSTDCTHQEIIDAQQEKLQYSEAKIQQLELELGRRSFLEDKQKRNEKAYGQSSRTLASAKSKSCTGLSLQQRLLEISNSLSDVELRKMKFLAKLRVSAFQLAKIREGFELFEELDAIGVLSYTHVGKLLDGIQRFDLLEKLDIPLLGNAERADGAFYMDEAPEHEPKDGAFCMEGDPVQEPRSHPLTGQTMVDRTTQSSSVPQRDHNLDLLPEKPSQMSSGDNLLQLQSSYEEGLTTTGGDSVTETRETDASEGHHMPQLCHPTDGELRDGVDSVYQNKNSKSDSKRKRKFLSAKNDDDVVRLITTAAERDSQEQIERLQRELQEYEAENQILQAELKRTSLPVDKHIGTENIVQLSREHAAGVASHVRKDVPGGAGPLPGARQQFRKRRQEGTKPKASLSGKDFEASQPMKLKDALSANLEFTDDSAHRFIAKQPDDEGSPQRHCPSPDEIRQLLSERNKKGNGTTSSLAELPERVKLLRISDSLSEHDVHKLKFLANIKPNVTAHRYDEIRDGLGLFDELENNGKLSRLFVGKLLQGIGRFDLVDILARPGTGHQDQSSCQKTEVPKNIQHFYVKCSNNEDKLKALTEIYVIHIERCIVFCNIIKEACSLNSQMKDDGHAVALLLDKNTPEERAMVLERLHKGNEKLLITTLPLRDISVEQVTVVVNYDMPIEPSGKLDIETYLERIGKTGRSSKRGIVVNFIDGQRTSMAIIKKIEEHFETRLSVLETNNLDIWKKIESWLHN